MTLNEIIHKILKPIAEDHLQINDFGFGDLQQLATNHTVKYPIMWASVNPLSYAGNSFSYSFQLAFADKMEDNYSDEVNIQSDMIGVAADVAAQLVNIEDFNISVEKSFTFSPFREKFVDVCAGVVMDVTIKVDSALNDCRTASKSNLL